MEKSYCVKCRKIVDVKNVSISKTKRGMRMQHGTCSVCGTKTSKILGK